MDFSQEQLQKFARFHEAAREGTVFNREFADANGLSREDLKLCIGMRAQLEAAARAAGLIA